MSQKRSPSGEQSEFWLQLSPILWLQPTVATASANTATAAARAPPVTGPQRPSLIPLIPTERSSLILTERSSLILTERSSLILSERSSLILSQRRESKGAGT